MSKHARVEAIRKLKEQLELAKDPETVLKITNQIARLTPKPRQARRPRSTQPPIKAKKGTSPIVAKWADRLSHIEPEEKRIEVSFQLEVEKRYKSRGIEIYPPTPESRALLIGVMKEVMGELSAEEQAVLNGGAAEVD